MKLQNPRHVMLTPESKRHFPMSSITISLRDLGLGANKGKRIDADLDFASCRPVGFLHEDGGIEPLNIQLLSAVTRHWDAEQSVICDLIDIGEINVQEEQILRFWHGDHAWCQAHCQSRYDAQAQSWQDLITILMTNEDLALAVADGLFRRETLRLRDIRWLCAERVSVATICEYKKQLQEQHAA